MKKSMIRFGIVLSLLGATAVQAQAWCLLPCFGLRCWEYKYANIQICKPYNAFTPFCGGVSVSNGCCPAPCCPAPCPVPCAAPCPAPCADPCAYAAPGAAPMAMAYYGGYAMPQTVQVGYQPYAYQPYAYQPYGYQAYGYGYPTGGGYAPGGMQSYAPYPVVPVGYSPYYWGR